MHCPDDQCIVYLHSEHQRDARECVIHLKTLLKVLPEEHYDLVKHVVRFLAIVACNEPTNKMSPMALAIVFGPNLFRWVHCLTCVLAEPLELGGKPHLGSI